MPIHFHDLDVVPEVAGLGSALIVPCNMCPAATVAARQDRPFVQLLKLFSSSAPFKEYLGELRARLKDHGVRSELFKSVPYHQWFMCMWTRRKRKKLQNRVKQFDAVIVLGCPSATETVREAVASSGCKVIEGMEVAGIMNARLGIRFPGNVTFESCRVVPISQDEVDRPTKRMV